MLIKKINNYQFATAILFITIFSFLILLNYSNCNVAVLINASKTFGIKDSIKNCKSNLKEFWYFKARDVLLILSLKKNYVFIKQKTTAQGTLF